MKFANENDHSTQTNDPNLWTNRQFMEYHYEQYLWNLEALSARNLRSPSPKPQIPSNSEATTDCLVRNNTLNSLTDNEPVLPLGVSPLECLSAEQENSQTSLSGSTAHEPESSQMSPIGYTAHEPESSQTPPIGSTAHEPEGGQLHDHLQSLVLQPVIVQHPEVIRSEQQTFAESTPSQSSSSSTSPSDGSRSLPADSG